MFNSYEDFGIFPRRILLFLCLALSAAGFEGFGMAMLLPVMQYLEKGRDVSTLAASSANWQRLVDAFAWMGWPLSLASLLTAVLGLMLLRILMVYARQYYVAWLSQEILHTTRMTLMDACLGARFTFFTSMHTGQMMNLLTTEAQRVGSGLGVVLTLGANSLAVAMLLGVLLWVSVPLTLVAVVFLTLAGVLVWLVVRRTKAVGFSVSEALKGLSFKVMERLMAFRLIKLTATSRREAGHIRDASAEVRDHMVQLRTWGAKVDLLMEPLVVASSLGIFYIAVIRYGMTLAEVGLFMLILVRLLPLAQGLLRDWQTYVSCQGAVAALRGGLDLARAEAEQEAGGVPFAGLTRGIRLEGVTFGYNGALRPALDQVGLEIPAGRMTALVGPSGAGKSTLADLLPRLQEPQAGVLFFDGIPARDYDLSSLRRGIAFVSQEAILFNDSVRANLAFVRPEATDQEIWQALEQAKAREFVEALPQGLGTPLGERGACLSGGQRQRIALARALLQGAPVIVLDEPTSALDSESELAIQGSIESLRRESKTTLVVIAHRLSTIRSADKIAVLENGRVVQQGTHAELALGDEWYAKVAAIQGGNGAANGGRA
jgi:subfamily B ATP-binding cassette protein MsbA